METHIKKYTPSWIFNSRIIGGTKILKNAGSPAQILENLKERGGKIKGQVVFHNHPSPDDIPVPNERFINNNTCWIEYVNLNDLENILSLCEDILDKYLSKIVIYQVGFYVK